MENEKRLIDANALMDEFRAYMVDRYDSEKCISEENCKACDSPCLWWRKVNEAPTVDAVEVVRGRWKRYIDEDEDVHYYTCSVCNYMAIPRYKYCPNCGAKMDGDGNG